MFHDIYTEILGISKVCLNVPLEKLFRYVLRYIFIYKSKYYYKITI